MGIAARAQPSATPDLIRESPYRCVLPRHGNMLVPGVVFASEALLPSALGDRSLWQVANVATLPGIVKASYAMPDIHWGYGFPIGGVAATDVEHGGVVSPGGVGFDISCGVRLLATTLQEKDVRSRLQRLMVALRHRVPAGTGAGGIWKAGDTEFLGVLRRGARAAVEAGYGSGEDLEHCEDGGGLQVDDVHEVSERAIERGAGQLGSLGSGNHFIEVQVVGRIFEPAVAERFGLHEGQVTVMIHTGSRGLGHQICSDHVREMVRALPVYRIELPDPQLAAAPVDSPHGRRYLAAMAAAQRLGENPAILRVTLLLHGQRAGLRIDDAGIVLVAGLERHRIRTSRDLERDVGELARGCGVGRRHLHPQLDLVRLDDPEERRAVFLIKMLERRVITSPDIFQPLSILVHITLARVFLAYTIIHGWAAAGSKARFSRP